MNSGCNNHSATSSKMSSPNASPKHQRSESMTSHRFYDTDNVDHKIQSFIRNTSASVQSKSPDAKIQQSRHLPLWAWHIIAKCNGIPLHPGSKPFFGTLLHGLTFAAALTYAVSYTWFLIYDIISPATGREAPDGTMSIVLVYYWCAFGFYGKDLSSRLFLHPRFLKDIRMHARTIFKINGALLLFILGAIFIAANIYESLDLLDGAECRKIGTDEMVCRVLCISRIVFSVQTLVWHSLVSFIFMSVCRTHTIGLRRFIREVEYDASITERHLSFTHKISPMHQEDIWQESLWIAEDENEDIHNYANHRHNMSVSRKDINPQSASPGFNSRPRENRGEISILFAPGHEDHHETDRSSVSEYEWNYLGEDTSFIPVRRMLQPGKDVPGDSTVTPHTMTNAELLHHFWKLNCRLRFSSCALQRWYASFVALVLLRCSAYLVQWLAHPAFISDILQFGVPLVILVVLSTAIAEVNFEGQRVLRCVYPTEQRIKPIQYMALNPLYVSIYGFGMTHGTIVTVVFAIVVGFVTKIVITEITK